MTSDVNGLSNVTAAVANELKATRTGEESEAQITYIADHLRGIPVHKAMLRD